MPIFYEQTPMLTASRNGKSIQYIVKAVALYLVTRQETYLKKICKNDCVTIVIFILKLFLKILQYSQENTCIGVSF